MDPLIPPNGFRACWRGRPREGYRFPCRSLNFMGEAEFNAARPLEVVASVTVNGLTHSVDGSLGRWPGSKVELHTAPPHGPGVCSAGAEVRRAVVAFGHHFTIAQERRCLEAKRSLNEGREEGRPGMPPRVKQSALRRTPSLSSVPRIKLKSADPVITAWPESGSPVLFVANLFHPLDVLVVQRFLNRDVCHRRRRRCTMPMLQTRLKPDYITGPNLLDRTALTLNPA